MSNGKNGVVYTLNAHYVPSNSTGKYELHTRRKNVHTGSVLLAK